MRRRGFAVRLAAVLMVIIWCCFPVMVTYAETTKDKLNQAEQDKKDSEKQLEDAQGDLAELEGQKTELQGKLSDLNSDLETAAANLEDLEAQVIAKNDDIEVAKADLEEAQRIADEQHASMLVRIRFMYEESDSTYLELLFSSKSFSDFLNKSEYIEKIEEYDRGKLEEYKEVCRQVEERKETLETELAQLEELKIAAGEEKDRVADLVASTESTIRSYSSQIEETEEAMLAIEAKIAEQNSSIEALKKQLEEEERLARLSAASAWRDISQVTFSENDRYLLANIIYCEAGNQCIEGQIAVGAVVINRMLSPAFPNTIEGVIYQKNQFSPVASGRFALALANNKATKRCYEAADRAMAGETTVENCLFFRTPIEGKAYRFQIQGHIFY